MSQVGWRLMVASSAKIRRPRPPCVCGDIARALATKAAMSSDVEDLFSGSECDLAASFEAATSPVRGFTGSPDIGAHQITASLNAADEGRLMRQGVLLGVLRGRHKNRNRSGIDDRILCLYFDGCNVGVVGGVEELVEHALDRGLVLLRSGVAHVVVLERRVHDGDARLLALIRARDDAGIGLELRVLGAE